MAKRGRTSSDELATLRGSIDWRPPTPEDLSAEEAAVWNLTVARMPVDWFPAETWPILKAMCRHTVLADKMTTIIGKNEGRWTDDDFSVLSKATAIRDRETRATLACARALRLTKQSQILPRGAGRKAAGGMNGEKPWHLG